LQKTPLCLFYCGQAQERSGSRAQALSYYEQALQRTHAKKHPVDILLALGLAQNLGPKYPETFSLMDEAVGAEPIIVHSLAMALQDQGDISGAKTLLDSLARTHPSSSYLLDQGIIAFLRGSKEESIGWFQAAVKLDPFNVRALYHLGIVREWQGQKEKALEIYSRAVRCGLEQRTGSGSQDPGDDYLSLAKAAQARLRRQQ
jgi:tetratricopeptide (TPR) repeat protein